MTDRMHLTVACVIERDGRFLMVRETDKVTGETVYNQPAGHVEAGETLKEAALRETLEETGWQVSLTAFLGMTTYTAPNNGVTYYRVVFAANPEQQLTQTVDPDIQEVIWIDRNDLQPLQSQFRSPLVMMAIDDYLNGTHYPLDMIREQR